MKIFRFGQFLVRSSASFRGDASRPAHLGYLSISSMNSFGTAHEASLPGLCAPDNLMNPPSNRRTEFLDSSALYLPRSTSHLANAFCSLSAEKSLAISSSGIR